MSCPITGLRLPLPSKSTALNSGTSPRDAQDSQAEADQQQKSSIYQLAEAVTDPGVMPAQVTSVPRMTPPLTMHFLKIRCSSEFRNYSRSLQQNSLQRQELDYTRYTCAYLPVGSLPLGSSHKPASNYILTFCFYHSEFEGSQKGELRNTHGSSHKHFLTFTWFCNTNKTDMPSLEGPWIRACR